MLVLGGVVRLAVGAKRVNEVNANFEASDAVTWAAIQGGVKGPAGLHTAGSLLLGGVEQRLFDGDAALLELAAVLGATSCSSTAACL